jgi:hypothetical protein
VTRPVRVKAQTRIHHGCVDDRTETLTPDGWKRHHHLRDGNLIAVWYPDTETWQFQPATFHGYPFDGELVAIDKRVTNQRLTPNHRVAYRTRKVPTPRFRQADTLTPGCQLPLAAAMDDGGVGPGEKAAALAGWFCTEGSLSAWSEWPVIHQSESANPQHVQTIRSLFDGLDADYSERRRERLGVTGKQHTTIQFTIRGALAEWLRQFHKVLPLSAVFGWSPADTRALFDAMVDGDGHRRPDGRMSFMQKDLAVAEAFQMLAVRLGYRTTLSTHGRSGVYVVQVSPARWIDLRAGYAGERPATSLERYTGIVWCPQVLTGAWVARRNGQPFITGNTWPPERGHRADVVA